MSSSPETAADGRAAEPPDPANRRWRVWALLAFCIAVPALALVLVTAADDGPTDAVVSGAAGLPEPGDRAPDFDLPRIGGGRVRLADHLGSPVVLTFFASWCHPCEDEIPHLNDALVAHADDDLVVLGISFRDLERDTVAFLDRLDAQWPAAKDSDDAAAEAYGVHTIPVTFFIDPDGVVVDRGFGLTSADAVEELVDRLLAAS